ncbi:serine hydrolase [Pedobacter aquatilis]|uniref:serine hydrolase n=1 Tax=Pedobacter aquatilis TaxID=351343 RepID=UPI00292DADC8|nr:serine hydrolase [Pedobacter aquatilis]
MKRSKTSIFKILFVLVLMITITCPMAMAQTRTDSISAYIKEEMIKRNIPGLQLAIIWKGKIELIKSYGFANIENRVSVTDSTLFSINSATKAFTGVAIMQLVEQGLIDLDGPLSGYLDSLPAGWRAIKIKHLLTHTSGLLDFVDTRKGGFVGGMKYQDAIKSIRDYPMEFAPGTQMRYNQTNYVLLGQLIEKLSGKPFEQFISERQFIPSGMSKTGFGDSRDVIMDKAPTYRVSRNTERDFIKGKTLERTWEEFPELRSTAGINSSAPELAKWIISLQNATLLKPQTLKAMWEAGRFNDGSYSGWAQGWVAKRNTFPRAVAGIGGSRSWFYVYPEQELSVIVLSNLSTSQPEDLAPEVAGFYYPQLKSANGGSLPESVLALRLLLEKQGYKKAIMLNERMRKKDAKSIMTQRDLTNWGYYLLLLQNRPNEAIEIFKLYAHLYPKDSDAWEGLAKGYKATGDNQNAIIFFQKTLQLDPNNVNAIQKLKDLKEKN